MTLRFDTDFEVPYGRVEALTPLVRRVVADNPGPFTFKGTATFVVGRGEVAVVDPGPDLDTHVDALLAGLGDDRVTHILVTHTHGDHSPACRQLAAITGATVYGFGPHPTEGTEKLAEDPPDPGDEAEDATTDERKGEPYDADFRPDVAVRHGDVIAGSGWTMEVVHTPGHLANHVCFALAEERTLFSGDHVMGWSTSVISPPGGDLADYLRSLELLLERPDELYRPTHGPAIASPHDHVRGLIEHRRDRERQIVGRLQAGDDRIPQIVDVLYDVDPKLVKAAGRSVLAHLLALRRAGTVDCDGLPGTATRWFLLA